MPKKTHYTMPEFAAITGRTVHDVKSLVLDGTLPAVPRFKGRDRFDDPHCIPLIDGSHADKFFVAHEPDTSGDPVARGQAIRNQASQNRQLLVLEEIDSGDPRVRHARAMQKWNELNKGAREALDEMSDAAKAMGES